MKQDKDLIGHNSKSFNKPDFENLYKRSERIVKSLINSILEKDLFFDFAKDALERSRVSTRVADRHEEIQITRENLNQLGEPLKLLKQINHAERNGETLPRYIKREIEHNFGKEALEYWNEKVGFDE